LPQAIAQGTLAMANTIGNVAIRPHMNVLQPSLPNAQRLTGQAFDNIHHHTSSLNATSVPVVVQVN